MNSSDKIKDNTGSFAGLLLGWSLVLISMRLGEWLINGFAHQFPGETVSFLLAAFIADFLFICQAGLILFVVFFIIAWFSLKAARISFIVLSLLLALGYFALQKYFSTTTVLLGADLYGYSIKDIQQTVGASGGLSIAGVGLIILLVAAIVFVVGILCKKMQAGSKMAMIVLGLLLTGTVIKFSVSQPGISLAKEYDHDLAQNKLDYFLQASMAHFFPEPHEIDIYSDAYSGDYGETNSSADIASFRYVNENEYPFLHADSTADVLTPFFNKTGKAPNIVIILVEGLGRAFSNEGAYLGNFTPFLDSLSQHSLYWENFLSGGGRTFAVLPSVLGSLPFAKNGFNELKEKMPPQLSLISLLKKNGYSSSFFYSGDASFDNMDLFMQKQKVDKIADKKTFPAGYATLPANNGFSWGYGDKELYRYFLESRSKEANEKPFVNVMLTVSTHSPFLINDAGTYEKLFDDRLSQLSLTSEQKAEANKYKQQYVTILYADDALRQFFSEYSQRPEFANTIFLVTGDHRMPEIPMSSKVDRYHVPLIVYSPLLQRTARFQSISSHFDITPSLLAYLKNNFSIQVPSLASWVGAGLDTARTFRNIHAQAFMQTKTDIIDYVKGTWHLNGENLFKIAPNMQEEPVTDENTKNALRGAFDRFLQKNEQVIDGRKLLPDSVVIKYYP